MARAARPQLAKLSRPRISRALARPRLFAALDRALEARGVWIAGGPGAGKTTLVSTYLDTRKHTVQWYQLDAQDTDVANVFHYLATAVPHSAARARNSLPVFTPDAERDLQAFARRFFRSFFAFAGSPLTLVFDNAHEAASEDLHCLLAVALGEVPLSSSLIVVSRDEIPEEFVGALASRTLSTLDPGSLKLTADEAVALAATLGDDDSEAVRALQRRVDGWPAGIVLLANVQRGTADVTHRDHRIEHVFDYFAAEVFSSLNPTTQGVLLATAVLPDFSASTAVAISETGDAARAIERCYRRHLFVERRDVVTAHGEHQRRYQYHPLFAAFLRERGRKTIAAGTLAALRRRAIAIMAESGQPDAAIAASLDAEELPTARALLALEAPADAAFRPASAAPRLDWRRRSGSV
jgi:ATP/maltotriose-dependent transcriptional regulator MalT